MNYTDNIFKRADIQQIRSFLMTGDECRTEHGTFEERIEEAERPVNERIHKEFPDESDYEDVMGLIYCYTSVIQDVYMEIGLMTGSILSSQVHRSHVTALGNRRK